MQVAHAVEQHRSFRPMPYAAPQARPEARRREPIGVASQAVVRIVRAACGPVDVQEVIERAVAAGVLYMFSAREEPSPRHYVHRVITFMAEQGFLVLANGTVRAL